MSVLRKQIKRLWKPDSKAVDAVALEKVRSWMKAHGLSTAPGSITMFLHSPVHRSARSAMVADLKLNRKKVK